MKVLLTMGFIVTVGVGQGDTDVSKFDYLEVRGHTIESTHKARYRIAVSESFKLLGQMHHRAVYHGVKFNVSMVAFSKGDGVIIVNAEMHADGSGGLDYSTLRPEMLDGIPFTSSRECLTSVDIPDPYSNPEMGFLRDKGFDVVLPVYLKHYFATSRNGTAEVVLTYGKRGVSCESDTLTDAFEEQITREVHEAMKVSMPE